MRICIITFFYKPAGGGIARYVEDIASKFTEQGHRVDILAPAYGEAKTEKEGRKTVYWLPSMNVFQNKEKNDDKAKEFLDFLRKYVRKKPSIFVAQSMHTKFDAVGHTLALQIASLESDIPTTLTVHSFLQDDQYAEFKLSNIKNLLWDRIISIGSTLAESLFSKDVPSAKINVSYPGVDLSKFKPDLGKKWLRSRIGASEGDIVILHASRVDNPQIADEKGIYTLLKAMSTIKQKNIKVLISAAPVAPPLEATWKETITNLRERAKLLGLEKRVIITTFSSEEMPLVYNGSDLCVLASKYENCSLVLSESQACGIPVISTTVGGIPEVVDNGRCGELISPDNHVELAKRITLMLKNPQKMKKMGIEGRKSVAEKQDLDKVCRHLLGIYESVIKRKSHPKSIFEKITSE